MSGPVAGPSGLRTAMRNRGRPGSSRGAAAEAGAGELAGDASVWSWRGIRLGVVRSWRGVRLGGVGRCRAGPFG